MIVAARRRAALLVALIILSLLAACGGDSAQAGDEITWQVWGDPEEIAVYEQLVEAYGREHPDEQVRLNVVPGQGDFMTKLSASFTAGNPPDVFLLNYRRYAQFAAKGVLEPLGPRLDASESLDRKDFFPVPLEAFTWEGTLQCIPFNMSSLVVYYNVDLFEAAGVPLPESDWTWADFLASAEALTRDTNGDGTIDVWGLDFEPTIIRAAPFIWSNGGDLLGDPANPRSVTLDSPQVREALQFFVDLRLRHGVVPDEATWAASDPESRFMQGQAAMTLNSRRAVPVFREIEGFRWDVAPPPAQVRRASTLHSDAFCVAAASKHKDAAWRFVEFAVGAEGQRIAATLGRTVPSQMPVAQSDAFLDPSRPPASSQVFLDLGPELELLPELPEWPEIEDAINQELYVAFFGHKPLDDAIADAEAAIQAALAPPQ